MQDYKHHILVIEDDERLSHLLLQFLSSKGYRATGAGSIEEARERIIGTCFDAYVVDVMLPQESGLDFVRSLKATGLTTPCIVLTAMGEPGERLLGLETGADDYMTKPFEPEELVLRIRNLLRRSDGAVSEPKSIAVANRASVIRFGPHEFDTNTAQLRTGNQRNALTSAERDLLSCFTLRPNEVLSRDQLADMLVSHMEGRSLDVAVARLRRKLEPNPRKPIYLLTARGQGWMLQVDIIGSQEN
ncbi:MAG: response regulator transcription factor [Alphaproteobacteria bacterium]|nr:response regulator transcription factor [Alphaproteobacteria bacterium]